MRFLGIQNCEVEGFGLYQMFRHGAAVGVQFHLEVAADDVERWAGAYDEELRQHGGRLDELLAQTRSCDHELTALAEKLIDNFVRIARNG